MKPEDLSRHLMSHGVRGVRYFDGGSRSAGEGTRNYVVFDDKHVGIRRKYEQGGRVGYATGGAPGMENEEEDVLKPKPLDVAPLPDPVAPATPMIGSGGGSGGMGSPGGSPATPGRSQAMDTATAPGNAAPVGGTTPAAPRGSPSTPVQPDYPEFSGRSLATTPPSTYETRDLAPPTPVQESTPISTRSVPSISITTPTPEYAPAPPAYTPSQDLMSGLTAKANSIASQINQNTFGSLSPFSGAVAAPSQVQSNRDVSPTAFGANTALAGTPPQADMIGMSGVTAARSPDVSSTAFGSGKSLAGTPPQADMIGMSGVTPTPSPFGGLSMNAFDKENETTTPTPVTPDIMSGWSPEGFSANLGPPGTAGISALGQAISDLGKNASTANVAGYVNGMPVEQGQSYASQMALNAERAEQAAAAAAAAPPAMGFANPLEGYTDALGTTIAGMQPTEAPEAPSAPSVSQPEAPSALSPDTIGTPGTFSGDLSSPVGPNASAFESSEKDTAAQAEKDAADAEADAAADAADAADAAGAAAGPSDPGGPAGDGGGDTGAQNQKRGGRIKPRKKRRVSFHARAGGSPVVKHALMLLLRKA